MDEIAVDTRHDNANVPDKFRRQHRLRLWDETKRIRSTIWEEMGMRGESLFGETAEEAALRKTHEIASRPPLTIMQQREESSLAGFSRIHSARLEHCGSLDRY